MVKRKGLKGRERRAREEVGGKARFWCQTVTERNRPGGKWRNISVIVSRLAPFFYV